MADLSTLDRAARARTLVASATDVQVSVAGVPLRVPFVDLDGAPLLVVPAGMAGLLQEDRLVGLRLTHTSGGAASGCVVLSGSLETVSHDLLDADVRDAIAAVARRMPARDGRIALLHLVLDAVVTYDEDGPASLDLDLYSAAQPQEVLARGWQLARHLNAHHAADLRTLAAGIRRIDPARVAVAEIGGIDPAGMHLRVIDREGAWEGRVEFGRSCTSLREVGNAIAATVAASEITAGS